MGETRKIWGTGCQCSMTQTVSTVVGTSKQEKVTSDFSDSSCNRKPSRKARQDVPCGGQAVFKTERTLMSSWPGQMRQKSKKGGTCSPGRTRLVFVWYLMGQQTLNRTTSSTPLHLHSSLRKCTLSKLNLHSAGRDALNAINLERLR